MINVLHAEEYVRPGFDEIVQITLRLLDEYNIKFDNHCRIFVDGANPAFIKVLKECVDEDPQYVKQIDYYKKQYPSVYDMDFSYAEYVCHPCLFF